MALHKLAFESPIVRTAASLISVHIYFMIHRTLDRREEPKIMCEHLCDRGGNTINNKHTLRWRGLRETSQSAIMASAGCTHTVNDGGMS